MVVLLQKKFRTLGIQAMGMLQGDRLCFAVPAFVSYLQFAVNSGIIRYHFIQIGKTEMQKLNSPELFFSQYNLTIAS